MKYVEIVGMEVLYGFVRSLALEAAGISKDDLGMMTYCCYMLANPQTFAL